MLQLAQKYAALKGTQVIASRIDGNSIIFVLASGSKLTMSTRQLEEAVADLENANKTKSPTVAIAAQEKLKKGKSKNG